MSFFHDKKKVSLIVTFILFLIVSLTFAFLNRNCTAEATTFLGYHVDRMHYYLGEKSHGYSLYPLWGYPLILLLFKDYNNIIYFQALLWGIVAFFLYIYIAEQLSHPNSKKLLLFSLLTSFPTLAIVTTRWPASFQLMMILLSVLFLYQALFNGKYLLSLLAGVLLGIAGNFRPEYVYLSIFTLFAFISLRSIIDVKFNQRIVIQLVLFVLFTWMALIPLGVERYKKTGHFDVFAGNGNWIQLFFTIGQLPNNSLGLQCLDGPIDEYLKDNLPKGSYDPNHPIHHQNIANDYAKIWFLNFVKDHPFEYLRKLLNNLKYICFGGFFIGQIENNLPESYQLSSVLMKEFMKTLIKYQNHPGNLNLLYDKGLIGSQKAVGLQDVSMLTIAKDLPFLMINFFFSLVFWVFIAFFVYRLFLLLAKKIRFDLIEFILILPIVYGSILMVLGIYQNRFTSMLYFFIITTLVYYYDKLVGSRISVCRETLLQESRRGV